VRKKRKVQTPEKYFVSVCEWGKSKSVCVRGNPLVITSPFSQGNTINKVGHFKEFVIGAGAAPNALNCILSTCFYFFGGQLKGLCSSSKKTSVEIGFPSQEKFIKMQLMIYI